MNIDVKRTQKRSVHATVVLDFVPDWVCCNACQLMETYSKPRCKATGLLIHDPTIVDFNCPLDFWIEEDNNGEYEDLQPLEGNP